MDCLFPPGPKTFCPFVDRNTLSNSDGTEIDVSGVSNLKFEHVIVNGRLISAPPAQES